MSILQQTEVSDSPDEEKYVPNEADAWIKQLEELELPSEDGVPLESNLKASIKQLKEMELPSEDIVPLQSNWQRIQINLLIDSVHWLWRDRKDFFAGGGMFIYYSLQQARNREYRGPDFFVVKDVDGDRDRDSWVLWLEKGLYPNVIVELASPSTIQIDLGKKKDLYEKLFRTPYYFVYDPKEKRLYGWCFDQNGYEPVEPDSNGRMRCEQLGADIGLWEGEICRVHARWVRLFDIDGNLVPTKAEAEARRADKAEAELERLRKELALLRQGK